MLDFCKEHPLVCALVIVLLVLMLVWRAEAFTNRTVNFIAYRNTDPTLYKYTNRIRNKAGLDMDDRYLENEMTYQYGLGAELVGDAAFASRVITEGTVLKDSPAPVATAVTVKGAEDFVGGMSY